MSLPDPSVSPADMIRLAIQSAMIGEWGKAKALADYDALLAAGERDKAETERQEDNNKRRSEALHAALVQRERDRRQIEQLTERDDWLLKQIDGCIESAETVANTVGLALARAVVGDLRDARAVLADEEDAGATKSSEADPADIRRRIGSTMRKEREERRRPADKEDADNG